MAIDSQNRRRNARRLTLRPFYRLGLLPSSVIDDEDRQHVGGGYIGISSTSAHPMPRARIGKTLSVPGGSVDTDGIYIPPLQAIGGSLAATAAGANQKLTASAGEGAYDFITRIKVVATAVWSGANSITLLDSSSGKVLWRLSLAAAAGVNAVFEHIFDMPVRCASKNGAFYITTVGASFTWDVTCSGYNSRVLFPREV
jgi:hypothetical protein